MPVITISRQSGSLGDELARYLADKTGTKVITRSELVEGVFGKIGGDIPAKLSESPKFFLNCPPDSDRSYCDILADEIRRIAFETRNVVFLGMGASMVLSGQDAVRVRVIASDSVRAQRTAKTDNITIEEADTILTLADRKHKRFVSTLYNVDLTDASLYDLTLNSDNLSVEEMADSVLALAAKKELRARIHKETIGNDSVDHQSETPVFKNESESEFARILDMYKIEWLYEPKTFPIEWDAEGNVTMAFSPDFYLPRFDLYLELTTMDQKYVTKKNKKMRRVKELYPGTNIRIVYKKDFEELIEKLKSFGG
ncbi:MAG: cytidylate kinase family protein [Clostridiales bacterium]|nr:cytidylate kinase family protein [Clostridiales bacterium]